jgi:MEMO1 family protein
MQTIVFVLLTFLIAMDTYSQNKFIDREPVAAGRFYSADKETLLKDVSELFASCTKKSDHLKVRALICPHAGYIFSGKIAAEAYSTISENNTFKNIFIIGSSHVMAFEGAAIYNIGDFITPLGKVIVNKEIAAKLIKGNKVFDFPVTSHRQEHSLEVQLPLIQYYFTKKPMIVPIVIGTDNPVTVKKIAEALKPWFTDENLFVISSDFSHYPSYTDAREADKATSQGILSGDPQIFLNSLKKNSEKHIKGLVTSMCGWTSGLTLLYLADSNKQLEFKNIDYCNSGDSPYGNKDEVVGYHAIALVEKNQKSDNVTFTREESDKLFVIARKSIQTMIFENKRISVDEKTLPEILKKQMGAFVTLKINGVLRGCIGRFVSSDPLYEAVRSSALSSAFEDPRFKPLTLDELSKITIEITVLGPLRRINNINEIILGKHGIYIKKDTRAGTMLPQVATEYGWTVEQFLGFTARDKAGLGWDGWRDAEIFIYDGVILEENRN